MMMFKLLFWTGCFSLLSVTEQVTGESEVIGSPEPVTAEPGQDVVLPCRLDPPFDVTSLIVEWKWNNKMVHVYRSQKDDKDNRDQRFKGRTSLFHDEMINGNFSLKLSKVTEEDAGNYTCFVRGLDPQVKKVKTINLKVGINDPDSTQTKHSTLKKVIVIIVVVVIVAVIVLIVGVIAGSVCYKLNLQQMSQNSDDQQVMAGQDQGAQDGQGGQQDNNQEVSNEPN